MKPVSRAGSEAPRPNDVAPPAGDTDAQSPHGEARLAAHIAAEIDKAGGWISFSRYMELALYAPGMGYYAADDRQFGAAGDFVTAPELGGGFAAALAVQVAELMAHSASSVIEAGAGSGRLAADMLRELERLGALPTRYAILDLSASLRARQRATLAATVPHLLDRVCWLDHLPATFDGVVLGNEVLDAMPVSLVDWCEDGIYERGVVRAGDCLAFEARPASSPLRERAEALQAECAIAAPYTSEIALAAPAWVATWGDILGRGALLLIDYGFAQGEFYHPQRNGGTLMCHRRHRASDTPLEVPGRQDITAHVDFTAIAESASAAGLSLLGYTTQASFLLNCGLTEWLAQAQASDPAAWPKLAGAAQQLLSPAEMGELFKVIALGRGLAGPLRGFRQNDRAARL
ncbi:class I SAM-dependent methyltransferase [Rhodocyclus gracilis]|uniref:Class I SAM-dependent methyltransferase n=1 Tax=Rhodocyclus tenuis TaxID=1066 RepID=A0A6L5JX73_RHOTE|nr:SAM-dependent methyltransferase [Rhodocyclus gracilis]MQY51819.1 class I SAM-dependent methyltransferase [Rhodocyclus gracilis]